MYIGYYQEKLHSGRQLRGNPYGVMHRYVKCFQHDDESECIRETSQIAVNNKSNKIRIDFLENGKAKVTKKMFIELG